MRNIKLCRESVEIVDNEKHLGDRLFDNKGMKGLVTVFYMRSNAVLMYVIVGHAIELFNYSHKHVKRAINL